MTGGIHGGMVSLLLKLLFVSGIIAGFAVTALCGVLIYEIVTISPKIRETAASVQRGSATAADYIDFQTDIIRGDQYQNSLRHGAELGKVATLAVIHFERRTLPRIDRAVDELGARLQTLDSVLLSLRGVTDETRLQVKQNGDAAAKTLASLNQTITDVDTRFSKVLDDGTLMLETANPKLQALLEHADNVIVDADGTIKSFQPITTNLTGITADFNAMTTDSKNKLHEILFPAPKHGWARVGKCLLTRCVRSLRGLGCISN